MKICKKMYNKVYKKTIYLVMVLFLVLFLFPAKVFAIPYSDLSDFLIKSEAGGAKQAQFADIDYDIVYVRCPRGKEPVLRPNSNGVQELLNWNGVNDIWLSATNNVYHQPGCDLVLHDSSMTPGGPAAETVLVNCDEGDTSNPVCSVVDPNVSFDGRYGVYTKCIDTRTFAASLGIQEINS
ncbi:MAG: hypothetical protein L3J83_04485, partial [Proteobacteria bacterium]|nr:hypothetical protein [Pseudomonadota bacterium]